MAHCRSVTLVNKISTLRTASVSLLRLHCVTLPSVSARLSLSPFPSLPPSPESPPYLSLYCSTCPIRTSVRFPLASQTNEYPESPSSVLLSCWMCCCVCTPEPITGVNCITHVLCGSCHWSVHTDRLHESRFHGVSNLQEIRHPG
jgi:hypothetical protein